jgi:hypothetical protein
MTTVVARDQRTVRVKVFLVGHRVVCSNTVAMAAYWSRQKVTEQVY